MLGKNGQSAGDYGLRSSTNVAKPKHYTDFKGYYTD